MKHGSTLLAAVTLLTLVLAHVRCYGVSAYPYKVMVETANGKRVEIFMRGDEHQRYAVTTDGYTLLSDSLGWWYATASEDGFAVKSEFRLAAPSDETAGLKAFKTACAKGIVPKRDDTRGLNMARGERRAPLSRPMTGERRALVVLMQFHDLAFTKYREDFVALFNDVDYHDNDATGSVRDYYRWASQGQLDYVSDVYGPYTANREMAYYGRDENNVAELCVEAILSLPKDMDYSPYDNDNDGIVDNVHIVFAGYGEEAGASSDAIWSHEYPHRIALKREVGYSFAGYSCTPELRSNRGGKMSHIGVVCHELGHALGAMDYYDTNYKIGGQYAGTGQWDIMADGSWNDDGRTPSNFNPYVRSVIYQWNPQVTLGGEAEVTMPRSEADNARQTVVYRLETGSSGDYFLLENRQKRAFDAEIPGEGLLIYHVHPNMETYRTTNTINASHPQGFYPVCASGSEPRNMNYGDINSAGCPFPGKSGARTFSASTFPAAMAWNGVVSSVSISNIRLNPQDGSITFSTAGKSVEPEEPDTPTEVELRYWESFETMSSTDMNVLSVFGKYQWRTYRAGNWVVDAERIPKPTNGNRILMLYSGKDFSMSESEFVSPYIEVEPVRDYRLSFDIYTDKMEGVIEPNLKIYIEDNRESRVYSLDVSTEQWTHVELPLRFGDSQFRYKLNGSISSGGIFIDNICLSQDVETGVRSQLKAAGLSCNVQHGKVFIHSDRWRRLTLRSFTGRVVCFQTVEPSAPAVISSIAPGTYLLDVGDGLVIKLCVR